MKTLLCAMTLLFASAVGAAEPYAVEARAALEKATAYMRSISTEGGYLWRYSLDLKERAGEEKATATQIWVQPPGTPSVGMAFLRAHQATGDGRYLDAAKAAAAALAAGQLESGGWDYLIEFDPALRNTWYRRSDAGRISAAEAKKRRNVSTYDDDNTTAALRLLVAVTAASPGAGDARDASIREARDYGLKKLIAARRPNGGWPQRWNGVPVNPADYPALRASIPPGWPREHTKQEDYRDYYTLNDHVQRNAMLTLLDAYRKLGVREYRDAALRGGEFLLLAQLPEPHPVWAQQYNRRMEPAWARPFEPPGAASAESAAVMRLLMDLYVETGDKKFLEPLPRAAAWFKRSAIEPNRWARLYELGTNKPIYGDRDGKIRYALSEVGAERRSGYAWQGDFAVGGSLKMVDEVATIAREKLLERRDATPAPARQAARAKSMEQKVRAVVAALDREGRWVTEVRGQPAISAQTFIDNVRVLSDYLEGAR